jgi:anti-sigma B factor antagonist
VSTNGHPGEYVVPLAGDLDVATVPEVADRLARLLDASDGDFVLDLADVEFCDGRCLAMLLELRDRVEAQGRRLIFRRTPPCVDRVLQITGYVDLFEFDD